MTAVSDTRMALVEFQDFKLNQQPIIFADASELQVFEDLLGAMELPTPPLSPDHAEEALSTDSSHQTEETELDVGETILEKMIDSENMVFDSQSTHCSEDMLDVDPMLLSNPQALLQDCMWSCGDYEPRHSLGYTNGVYTPAPSPSPEAKQALEEDSEEAETIATFGVDKSAEEEPAECISPNEVLVFTGTVECTTPGAQSKTAAEEGQQEPTVNTRKASLSYRRSVSSVSSGSSRLHPQATSSESEEEIDVVTITDRPQITATRTTVRKPPHQQPQRRASSSSSVSAPCSRQSSRQSSPVPRLQLNKKRRCHSKRTHRLSSAGSNFGDGLDSEDEQRRASHNVLERKRRNDLKSSFQILRGQIPELEENQRAPKVTILRKAAEYIKQIRDREDDLQSRMAMERRREAKLLQRLAYLKSLS